jgi:phosphatidate phosphatase APP1
MLHEDGSIDKLEWNIYRQWHHHLSTECQTSGIVYITCSPENCFNAVKQFFHRKWFGNVIISP